MSELPVVKWIGGGRYGLMRELGSGGFGRVWMAHDTHLGRTVAVKEVFTDRIPPADLPGFIERARREASNSAALSDHPNIVSVHDIVTENGIPWIVMQLVRGTSLAGYLNQHPGGATQRFTADLAEQTLLALSAAHAIGLVHRDVKPQNILIMVDDRGAFVRCVLADFGLAKSFTSAGTVLTRSGELFGSWAYAAPERSRTSTGDLPSGDLFSLGVVLFEAVEGYSPFRRDEPVDSIMAVVNEPLPAMRRAGPLAPLISALTAKEPAERPSIDEALEMLAAARKQRATPTAPVRATATRVVPPPPPPGPLPAARRGSLASRVGCGALLLMMLLLATTVAALWARSVTFAEQGDCVNLLDGDWSYNASCSIPAPWASNYRVLYTTEAPVGADTCRSRVPDWTPSTDVQVSGFKASNGHTVSMCLRPLT
ncbi:serine/threonine-protein kinase [Streptomyces sp. NPDC090077]|uniref:serine/threonine-protein kinase n=1 Tax=Streptomyces sp. NPDC090077 TaxID=3365938 RepID=UPI0038293C9B